MAVYCKVTTARREQYQSDGNEAWESSKARQSKLTNSSMAVAPTVLMRCMASCSTNTTTGREGIESAGVQDSDVGFGFPAFAGR